MMLIFLPAADSGNLAESPVTTVLGVAILAAALVVDWTHERQIRRK
jgi:hypothetical protein